MSKKNIITIFLSAICTLPLWGGQQYYAFLKGDTLRMGNNYMERAMRLSEGNVTRAAEYLGITRFALYRKLEKLGL